MPNPILAIRRKASSFRENRVKPLFVTRPRIMPEAKTTDSTTAQPQGKFGLLDPKLLVSDRTLQRFDQLLHLPPSFQLAGCTSNITLSGISGAINAYLESCPRPNVSYHIPASILPPYLWEFGVIESANLQEALQQFAPFLMVEVFEQGVDYTLDEMVFYFCHFNLSDFEIGHLLRSWRPRSVTFINCDWRDVDSSQTVAISDSLFALNTQLQSFVFSNIGCKKLLVSDRTLQRFDQLLHLPHSFQLAGCTSNITLSGISGAINAYLESCPRPNVSYHIPASILPPYLWEFGIIENANLQEALQHFAPLLKHGYVAQSSSSNLELRFTSALRHLAPLYVTIGFRVALPMAYVSPSVDGEDIPWDDSDGENDTESD